MDREWAIVVGQTGRTWSVFGVVRGSSDDLIEGGFFTLDAANEARDRWIAECTQDEVEAAERHAGWDPNP